MPLLIRRSLASIGALACLVPGTAYAQLTIRAATNVTSSTSPFPVGGLIVGSPTTAGQPDNACVYLDANGNIIGNGFIERGGEQVFGLTNNDATADITLAISQTAADPGTDIDYFLVTSLDTQPVADAGDGMPCDGATGGVSVPLDSSGIFEGFLLRPGETVYLVCDTFANPGAFDVVVTPSVNTTPDITPNTNSDLGELPIGSLRITGSTAGATNQIGDYFDANGARVGFAADRREIIRTFTVPEECTMQLNSNDGIFVGVDHDHYLLASPSAGPNNDPATKTALDAIGFVDESGDFGATLQPGTTYYLVVDTFSDPGGDYDITVMLTPTDAITEDEADCLSVNAGCSTSPAVFTPVTLNETHAGTLSIDTGTMTADEDWYAFTLTEQTLAQVTVVTVTGNAIPTWELFSMPGGLNDTGCASRESIETVDVDTGPSTSRLYNLSAGDYAVRLVYPTATVTVDIPCAPDRGQYLFQVFAVASGQLTVDIDATSGTGLETPLNTPITSIQNGTMLADYGIDEACFYLLGDEPFLVSPDAFAGTTGGEQVIRFRVPAPCHAVVSSTGNADFDYFLLNSPVTSLGLNLTFDGGQTSTCDGAIDAFAYSEDDGLIPSAPLLPGRDYYLVADIDAFTTPSPGGQLTVELTLVDDALDADCDGDVDADDAQIVCDIVNGLKPFTGCKDLPGDVDFDGDTDADDAAFYCEVLRALPGGLVEGQVPDCIDCGTPDVIYVDDDWTPFRGPPTFGPFSSERNIQSAIDRIADDGTIFIYPGTYDFFGNNQTLDLGTKNLTIEGLGVAPDEVSIPLRVPGPGPMDQAFRIAGGQDETTRIANVRFDAQFTGLSPSVFVSNAAPRFESCVFAGGGGIASLAGSVTVSDSTPSLLTATVFEDCVFTDPLAIALNVNAAQVRLNRCRMETQSPGVPLFLRLEIGASAQLTNCTITADLVTPLTLIQSNSGSSLALVNCSVAGVTSTDDNSTPLFELGGSDFFSLDNTIIADNRDGDGDIIPAFSASLGVIGPIGGSNNLSDDLSIDPLIETALGDPLFVDSAGGDFRLSPGSPAIDAGSNALYDQSLWGPTDIAGVDRFLDDTGTPDTGEGTAPIIDIGAHEFDGTTPTSLCVADFDGDGDVDLTDFGTFGAAFGSMTGDANYNADADFDNDSDVDLTDFGTFGSEFGSTPAECLP